MGQKDPPVSQSENVLLQTRTRETVKVFSTKKKKAIEKRFAKATGDEKENCLVRLDDVEVRFCALCMSEDVSDMTGNINVSWTQCSTCGIWLHDEFCCKNCVLHTTFYEVFLISLKYKQKLE